MLDRWCKFEARQILRTAIQRAGPRLLVLLTPDPARRRTTSPLTLSPTKTPSLQPIRMRHSTLPHRLRGFGARCEALSKETTGLKLVKEGRKVQVEQNKRGETAGLDWTVPYGEGEFRKVSFRKIRVADGPGSIYFTLSRIRWSEDGKSMSNTLREYSSTPSTSNLEEILISLHCDFSHCIHER